MKGLLQDSLHGESYFVPRHRTATAKAIIGVAVDQTHGSQRDNRWCGLVIAITTQSLWVSPALWRRWARMVVWRLSRSSELFRSFWPACRGLNPASTTGQ